MLSNDLSTIKTQKNRLQWFANPLIPPQKQAEDRSTRQSLFPQFLLCGKILTACIESKCNIAGYSMLRYSSAVFSEDERRGKCEGESGSGRIDNEGAVI